MRQQTVKSAAIIGEEDNGGMLLEFLTAFRCDAIIGPGKSVIVTVRRSCAVELCFQGRGLSCSSGEDDHKLRAVVWAQNCVVLCSDR